VADATIASTIPSPRSPEDSRAQQLIDTAPDGFIGMGPDGLVTTWNRAAERLFGYRADEAVGRLLDELIIREEDREAHQAGLRRYLATGRPQVVGRPVQVMALHRDGHEFPIDLTIWTQPSPYGVSFYAFLRDVTDRVAAAETESRLAAIVTSSPDAIMSADVAGTVQTWNAGAETVYGYAAEDMIGRNFARLVPDDRTHEFAYLLDAAGDGRAVEQLETVRVRADGTRIDVALSVSPVHDSRGDVTGLAYVARDITAAKAAERHLRATRDALAQQAREMEHRAFHDALTGLPNRALLLDRLGQAIVHATRTGGTATLLIVDIDDFKNVNDTLGHTAGDELLCEVAVRLASVLRAGDTVARLGGDEFAILAEHATPSQAALLADRIDAVLGSPLQIDGQPVAARASVGLAPTCPEQSPEEVLRNADLAMYAAKTAGKGRWRAFHPDMHHELRERVRLETDLAKPWA
jgi:diguanylate cyclase (GGDEF)-like protein/PAS domain S-box-containing protein